MKTGRFAAAALLGLFIAAAPFVAGPARAVQPGDLLATVNGDSIIIADLDAEMGAYRAAVAKGGASTVPEAGAVLRRLVQNRLLEQEGYRIGADSMVVVRNQVKELIRHKGMMALLDSVSAGVPMPDSASIDSLVNVSNRMNRVSHILVKDESFARALQDSLRRGVSFEDLAARYSIDSTSAVKNGDLGWAREGLYVPEFEATIESLDVGETAGPVKTKFGWHLVRLADRRVENLGRSEEMTKAVTDALMQERVMGTVRVYIESLREKYGMVVNESLLTSLDYGSEAPDVQNYLRTSNDVLASSPIGRLTVSGLTKDILYVYFHGLAGKPDAAAVRDKMFEEYFAEALLSHEARVHGFGERAEIRRQAELLERNLLREQVLKLILDVPFDPSEDEVRALYEANQTLFTPKPRIKIQSAVLADEASAREFKANLEKGAKLKWLAERASGVIAVDPEEFSGWVEPSLFGEADALTAEYVGPIPAQGGFVVGVVDAVERVQTPPLDECRPAVLRELRRRRNQEMIGDALDRLEKASTVKIGPKAESMVAERIRSWVPEATSGTGDPASPPDNGSRG